VLLLVLLLLLPQVGYNNKDGYWIARNSWGQGFADAGYFKVRIMSYAAAATVWRVKDIYTSRQHFLGDLNDNTSATCCCYCCCCCCFSVQIKYGVCGMASPREMWGISWVSGMACGG
jgi:hypothetical protein